MTYTERARAWLAGQRARFTVWRWKRRVLGQVLYSTTMHRFFQVRGFRGDLVICGDFTKYFLDATTVGAVPLSIGFVSECQEIGALDEFGPAHYDGKGWRINTV